MLNLLNAMTKASTTKLEARCQRLLEITRSYKALFEAFSVLK